MHRSILKVPSGYKVEDDPRVDRIVVDDTVESPVLITEDEESIPYQIVGRDKINNPTRDEVNQAFLDYEDSKLEGDSDGQISALERIVAHTWHVLSGDAYGSAVPEEEQTTE